MRVRQEKIEDAAGHFKGKTIRVTGMATMKDAQPQIEVNDPDQIEVVPSA